MKVFSSQSIYGLRALLYMLAHSEGEHQYVRIRELSESLDISFHFLTKILQVLTQNGILKSYRGPGGGVLFARSPQSITLTEIITTIEGKDFFDTCLLGLPGCGAEKPCPMHEFWASHRNALKKEFDQTNLAELSEKVRNGSLRLS